MTPFLLVLLAAVGLVVGSFLNVCIGRLPQGESVVFPGSHCPNCGAAIHWYDNLPVLSYVLLGGRCRSCRGGISIRYPIIEVVTSIAFVTTGFFFVDNLALLVVRLMFVAAMVALFGTDLETQRLPNVITLPGIVVGLVASLWLPPGLLSSALGALIGAGILMGVRSVWKWRTGVEGMGLGDVKMLAMIGACLGWRQVWAVLFLASLAGALVGGVLAATRARSLQSRLPFGTFMAVAAVVAALIGEDMIDWYLQLY
jgi:leader peptidase (prepilin peptidase) / N-methyltransferase